MILSILKICAITVVGISILVCIIRKFSISAGTSKQRGNDKLCLKTRLRLSNHNEILVINYLNQELILGLSGDSMQVLLHVCSDPGIRSSAEYTMSQEIEGQNHDR